MNGAKDVVSESNFFFAVDRAIHGMRGAQMFEAGNPVVICWIYLYALTGGNCSTRKEMSNEGHQDRCHDLSCCWGDSDGNNFTRSALLRPTSRDSGPVSNSSMGRWSPITP